MVLADASVWIDHFRRGNTALAQLLDAEGVTCHPFVIGELACGNLRNRDEVLALLGALPAATVATNDEVMTFVAARRLMGLGLGWVDVHLLASAKVDAVKLWTLDKRLAGVAANLKVAATP